MSTNWHGFRLAAWAGMALTALVVGWLLVQGNITRPFTLGCFLAVSFAFVRWDHRLPNLFDLLFVLAALINAGGWVWDLYNQPGPYDEIAHAYTIFALTLALGFLVYRAMMSSFHGHRLLFVLTIASFGIAIGGLWEVAEWLADFMTVKQIVSGLTDTITDIIMDTLGAVAAALFSLRALGEKSPAELDADDTWTTQRSAAGKPRAT